MTDSNCSTMSETEFEFGPSDVSSLCLVALAVWLSSRNGYNKLICGGHLKKRTRHSERNRSKMDQSIDHASEMVD